MSVWLCIPARRDLPESTIPAWIKAGYKVATCREKHLGYVGYPAEAQADINIPFEGEYPGWSICTNLLIHEVMMYDASASWFVCGGDDTFPDPHKTPDQIALACGRYFGTQQKLYRQEQTSNILTGDKVGRFNWSTFGIMQPTGDDWRDSKGKTIERIAGSPWIGREFARRMYHGGGPLYAGFTYSFADEHLQNVAQKLGVFWQRSDLTHEHRHIARDNPNWQAEQPEWTRKLYAREQWDRNKALFERLKAGGFKEAYDLLD